MSILLSASPIVFTVVALAAGVRSLHAALLGVGMAVLAIVLAFPMPAGSITSSALRWAPLMIEVLLIVGGGLLLSDVLRQSGGQAALAAWIRDRAGRGVAAVLLVVHGITPFAESVTGFGIGVTIGIPLLAHFGLPARKTALIGLLGLCAVPWGSMGPGTLIAATLSGVSFNALGVASACLSTVAFTIAGMAAACLASPRETRGAAILAGAGSGLLLTLAVGAMNLLFGTAPAGALGALLIIALHLLRGARDGAGLAAVGRRSLMAYAILLGGVLLATLAVAFFGLTGHWRYVASPALWLFVAVLCFSGGAPDAPAASRAWRSWLTVAPVTGLFILLGVLMAISGMAATLAGWLAQAGPAYLAVAPFVGAAGGFITGSNSGANAMFAATQAEIARTLGVDVLWFMAVHNVAAAFLLMASPGKVEMAIQLSPTEAAEHRLWIQRTVLIVALVVVSLLAIINVWLALAF